MKDLVLIWENSYGKRFEYHVVWFQHTPACGRAVNQYRILQLDDNKID